MLLELSDALAAMTVVALRGPSSSAGRSQPGQTWEPEEHNLGFSTEDDVDPFVFRGERMGHALGR